MVTEYLRVGPHRPRECSIRGATVVKAGLVGQRGTISGAGGLGSLVRRILGGFSVFRKVRSELLRPLLDLLDPAKHLRICF